LESLSLEPMETNAETFDSGFKIPLFAVYPTIHRYRRSIGKSSTQVCHQTFCRLTTGACCHACLGYVSTDNPEHLTGLKVQRMVLQ
jgi:hypothetical protein